MQRHVALLDGPTVFVIDPDPTTGEMTRDLLDGSELPCETFTTCQEFLAAYRSSRPGCLVLEQRIADMSGLQLQRRLAASGTGLPRVFVLSDARVAIAVELLRDGAVHVLEKPLRPIELLTAIQEALDLDQDRRCRAHDQAQIRELVVGLTRKEREVLDLIAQGRSVKSMAAQLELSVRAIEQRRRSLMEKLRTDSPLALMRFSLAAQRLNEPSPLTAAGRQPARCATG